MLIIGKTLITILTRELCGLYCQGSDRRLSSAQRRDVRRTITAAAFIAIGLAASVIAANVKGVVMDEKCSGMPDMKSNVDCIQKCIKAGSPAVLVTAGGKGSCYKIADQDKILASAGRNVTANGKLAEDTIAIASVK